MAQSDDESTQRHIDSLDPEVDLSQDETTQFFGGMTQDAYDEAGVISERIDELIKELKNPEMVRYIRESRLALVKKIAELEAKLPEIKKLEARVEEKTNSYAKKENTSEEIASIMLKVVDKRYRADSLKLSEFEKELFDAKHTLQVLDRMEREVTGLLIPENMLEKYVNGKGTI
ncbi:MAG: hypothetical protein IJE91_04225 [Clostridia bacterium]|nr:hypothetical protein [Clostridia bacterium]